jgi:hypothetical protein
MEKFTLLTVAITIAGAFALLAARVGWNTQPAAGRRRIELGIIITLAIISIGARLTWIPFFHGARGGDPYNYLFITKAISRLENPFETTKRLPGYPLVLLPAYWSSSIDDIVYMRTVSAISSGATLILVALLARTLKLPWSVQLGTVILLSVQKDFWWTSLRPEPYTFYTALLFASLFLFFHLHKPRTQIMFSAAVGYAAITRQEGFALALLLGIAAIALYRKKLWWKGYVYSFLPALFIVLPFFANSLVQYGNPLYTPYFEGEKLQIVDSWEAFKDNLGATWGILGTLWRPLWHHLYRIPLTEPLLAVSVLVTTTWWAILNATRASGKTYLHTSLIVVMTGLWIGVIVWLTTISKKQFSDLTMLATAGILLASTIPFFATTRWRGGIVWLVLASQLLIATWFLPFPKYYQQSYPLLILLTATTLFAPLTGPPTIKNQSHIKRFLIALPPTLYYWVILTPFITVSTLLASERVIVMDEHNHDAALDHVTYEAVQAALHLPGPHGIEQGYLSARLYFEGRAFYFNGDEHEPREKQLAWLREHNIRTLVTTNASSLFDEPETSWQRVFSKKAEGDDERIFKSSVYLLPQRSQE